MTDAAYVSKISQSRLRLFVVVWPFIAIILCQAAVASFSMEMVSCLRAYVAGESLWSKGQHDAVYYLGRYISSNEPAFLVRFNNAMTYPIGDREARLAMEKDPPNIAGATAGFLAAGNHPSDVPGLIWLFQYFRWFSYMRQAIGDWRVAEAALLQLNDLAADTVRAPTGERRSAQMARLDAINDQITPLTTKFSVSLGDGTRFVQNALLYFNLAIAALFSIVTIFRLNNFVRHRRRIEDELSWHASHDDLTGLPNRRRFELSLADAMRDGAQPMSLMFIDLDQFKVVNDSGGHAAGDALLRQISDILVHNLRAGAVVARLGGDEFGLLLLDCSEDNGVAIARRLREAIESIEFFWQGQHHKVSASIGLVHLGGSRLTLAEAMRAADLACYIAKEQGRNRVHVHAKDDAAEAELAADMGWVRRLHRALDEDQFELHAQPIVATVADNQEGEHLELLLRMRDPARGELVPPGAFIPAAERFGMMPAIDRWVVRTALRTIAARGRLALRATYSINLSGLTLGDDQFETFLRDEFAATGVAPEVICFEITETGAIANLDRATAFIGAMRQLGCRFALDDFGVGMSSLTYLKRLPVDYLKIDGSFVRDMMNDRSDFATVQMINHLAHLTDKKTIAEFVESTSILQALTEMGIDYVQGYEIAKPFPFLDNEFGLPADIRLSA